MKWCEMNLQSVKAWANCKNATEDVLMAFNVTNPATQHAIKKLLMPGNRGHKDKLTDLKEAYQSIVRAIELESEDAS